MIGQLLRIDVDGDNAVGAELLEECTMAQAMISAWTFRLTNLIFETVGDEFIKWLISSSGRRDTSSHQFVALEVAEAMPNTRRINSPPSLNHSCQGIGVSI